MKIYDTKIVSLNNRPLFQTGKVKSPMTANNEFEDFACFFYILGGVGEVIESNGSVLIQKQEGLIKSCGRFISNYFKDQDDNDFEAILIYLYPDLIQELYPDIIEVLDQADIDTHPQKILDNKMVATYVEGLHLYFEHEDLIDEHLAKIKIKELNMILLKSNYFESVKELFRNLFKAEVKSFHQIIKNNIFNDLSIDQLAFLTHKSLSTFKRDFKKEFNSSPAKYIKRKRLEQAAFLLKTTNQTISKIAYSCCFQDLSTFSAVFKSHYNESPTTYRLTQIRKLMDE